LMVLHLAGTAPLAWSCVNFFCHWYSYDSSHREERMTNTLSSPARRVSYPLLLAARELVCSTRMMAFALRMPATTDAFQPIEPNWSSGSSGPAVPIGLIIVRTFCVENRETR